MLNKYGDDALSDYKFHNHIYYPDISMWINNDICQLERNTGVIGGINLGVNIKIGTQLLILIIITMKEKKSHL